MKVLLSPAKKLDFESPVVDIQTTEPVFLEHADKLASKLNKTSFKGLKNMMSLSDALTELNKTRYAQWNDQQERPAALSFNGDVYLGLDAPSLNKEELEWAQDSLRIISGLYGILKPLDLIKPYRLEMGSRWAVTKAKTNLYKYWGKTIAQQLEEECTEDEPIINLASAEYAKAILPHLNKNKQVITAEFKEYKNGELKMIQVFVKKARGMMARHIIKNKITSPEDLITFDTDGYQYEENLSTPEKLIFTR